MSEILNATLFIIVGLALIATGGTDENYAKRNGKPLVVKIANREVGIIRIICVTFGLTAVAVGVLMLLGVI